jgi:GAF domain-containing protein
LAIRSGETVHIQDFATDPRMAPWRDDALARGYRSGISLPLKDENNTVFGVLLIYSTEPYAVTAEEFTLLEELAGDLAFGITVLRTRITLQQTGKSLQESEALYRIELEQRVLARTAELSSKNAELERLNRLFVGRELRMIELKERIRVLEGKPDGIAKSHEADHLPM